MIRPVVDRALWMEKGLSVIEMMFLHEIEPSETMKACLSRIEYFVKKMKLSLEKCTQIIESLNVKGCLKI